MEVEPTTNTPFTQDDTTHSEAGPAADAAPTCHETSRIASEQQHSMRIAAWNANGLNSIAVNVITKMTNQSSAEQCTTSKDMPRVDFLVVSEIHSSGYKFLKEHPERFDDNCVVTGKDPTGDDTHGGVAIFINPRMRPFIQASGAVGPRVCWIRVQTAHGTFATIAAAYAPPNGDDESRPTTTADVIANLTFIIETADPNDELYIVGDLNANFLPDTSFSGQFTVPGTTSDANGECLNFYASVEKRIFRAHRGMKCSKRYGRED